MIYKNNKLAFTLVELIVVMMVLWLLATIWFVSYSWYIAWTRDSNRIANLVSLHDALELNKSKNSLALPDDYIEVISNGSLIAYQWDLWEKVLQAIGFSNWWLDPKNNSYFSYYVTSDRKYFQLMAFLEEEGNLQIALTNNTYASDYSTLYPSVYWYDLWILTDSSNTPIQKVNEIVLAWTLNLSWTNSWTVYKAYIKDWNTLEFSWSTLSDKLTTLSYHL